MLDTGSNDPNVLPRLDLIRRARALDVDIGELGELLDIAEGRSERAHEELASLVALKLLQTVQRIEELRALEHQLRNVQQRRARDATAPRVQVPGCGPLLCTCPVNVSSDKGGEEMKPTDLEEQNTESTSSSSCDCGCECCAGTPGE